jgi:hypothetical protein
MSNLNIIPQRILLTSGHAVTFEATDAEGKPASVNWSWNPTVGSLMTVSAGNVVPLSAGSPATPSATYVAPQGVANAVTVAVIASTEQDSASTMIALTPDAITIVPQRVDLEAGQEQQFIAIVAAAPVATETPDITWILSPPIESLDQNGLFKAPPKIRESMAVSVIAASRTLGKQAVATVNLVSPPWQTGGVHLLGAFLLFVFSFVCLMILLWPPALPSPDTARANRIEAEKALENRAAALQNAEAAKAKALEEAALAEREKSAKMSALPGKDTAGEVASLNAAKAKITAAEDALKRASDAQQFAAEDLTKKQHIEERVNESDVQTKLGSINRELDLLLLVLLAGFLGSFLHVAQSYSDYVGNRAIKRSWAWWYCFRPFIGGGLAVVFYAAIRGGFMAIAAGSSAKASELNPFGLVAMGALVGMFSKAATMKLGEVFDTIFKLEKPEESKDKLAAAPRTSGRTGGKTTAGGSESSSAPK